MNLCSELNQDNARPWVIKHLGHHDAQQLAEVFVNLSYSAHSGDFGSHCPRCASLRDILLSKRLWLLAPRDHFDYGMFRVKVKTVSVASALKSIKSALSQRFVVGWLKQSIFINERPQKIHFQAILGIAHDLSMR